MQVPQLFQLNLLLNAVDQKGKKTELILIMYPKLYAQITVVLFMYIFDCVKLSQIARVMRYLVYVKQSVKSHLEEMHIRNFTILL